MPQTGSFSVVAVPECLSIFISTMVKASKLDSAGNDRLASLQTEEESKTYTMPVLI
jgi:hypothetical protein